MIAFFLRWAGFFVLCVSVGVALEKVGLPAHGTLHDVWRTIVGMSHQVDRWIAWSIPYALLGGLVCGPLLLLALFDRRRRQRRR